MEQTSVSIGVANMLYNCAEALAGQRILIAYEPPEFGFFDADVVTCVAQEATKLGFIVDLMNVGFESWSPKFSDELLDRMDGADVVVFLARIGDQLRFSGMLRDMVIVNSYTLNKTMLGSPFASAHYGAFLELKSAVDRLIAEAEEILITCPKGTFITGRPNLYHVPACDTTLRRFPLSVFSPVPASGFSGRVALAGFLTGTGSHYYEDYTVEFEGATIAVLKDGRLVGFEGAASDVAKANAQYDRVSALFGIDRNFVHSWHAGIHPGCGFTGDAAENYEAWGGAAFGNPRVLHFHTCGAYAPGEISWNTLDPTIWIDGVAYWKAGCFQAELLPEGREILERYPCAGRTFANPDRSIGIGRLWS
ncbi:MAG: hypothetical protein ABJL67_02410 [Sulfitobacter sp.]